jgi:dienelactone hydrolase
VDKREPFEELSLVAAPGSEPRVARSERVDVCAVRWPVLKGVDAEGLLLQPAGGRKPLADIVAIPDAGQTPEEVAGVAPGDPFALHLAEAGCRVLVPVLIDRADTYSVSLAGQATNQPHREWVYRPAFEVGRHVIGYEVQKVLGAIDFFSHAGTERRKIGVMGYGEGGVLALYAAALDERIEAACVSGYFGPRENLWRDPIYRNLFGVLNEFGDAELAAMVAPRALIVDACEAPKVNGPPPVREGRRGAAPGRIETPQAAGVRQEIDRAQRIVRGPWSIQVSTGAGGDVGHRKLLAALGVTEKVQSQPLESLRPPADPQLRMKRQIEQLSEFTQALVRESEYTRRKFWEKADAARKARSAEQWAEATQSYRDYFENEVIGRFDRPLVDPNVRTRPVYDTPKFSG